VDITPKNKINVALTRTRDPTRLDSDLPGGGISRGSSCLHALQQPRRADSGPVMSMVACVRRCVCLFACQQDYE